jgi:hypothetical protein
MEPCQTIIKKWLLTSSPEEPDPFFTKEKWFLATSMKDLEPFLYQGPELYQTII